MKLPPLEEWEAFEAPGDDYWWVRCTRWDGEVTYEGPAPVPADLCVISLDDALSGRLYTFDMIPIRDLN
jgi:hypothetical protein